jgi:hypothetical protein
MAMLPFFKRTNLGPCLSSEMGTEYSSGQLSTFSQRTTSTELYSPFRASALAFITDPTSGVVKAPRAREPPRSR